MALLNAVKNGTYTIVKPTLYQKSSQRVHFLAVIYDDSTKKDIITTLKFNLQVQEVHRTYPNKGVTNLPVDPEVGDSYLIGENPAGEAANFEHGQIVVWTTANGGEWWASDALVEDSFYYIESEDEFYKWKKDIGLILQHAFLSEALWDSLFSINAVSQAGNNITQACYEYLKLLPEFESTVDA